MPSADVFCEEFSAEFPRKEGGEDAEKKAGEDVGRKMYVEIEPRKRDGAGEKHGGHGEAAFRKIQGSGRRKGNGSVPRRERKIMELRHQKIGDIADVIRTKPRDDRFQNAVAENKFQKKRHEQHGTLPARGFETKERDAEQNPENAGVGKGREDGHHKIRKGRPRGFLQPIQNGKFPIHGVVLLKRNFRNVFTVSQKISYII